MHNEDMEQQTLPDDLIGTSAAAKMLAVSPKTLRGWIKDGKVPAFRIGSRMRVSRRDVLAVIQRVETDGPRIATRAEVEAHAKWVDDTLKAAGVRK